MAQSPSSEHRARLIREMSRDLNRTRHSSTSLKGSRNNSFAGDTISDFDPENEALMSTRQFENTTGQLPQLRASAQKYRRYTPPEPDYAINTSAIGRAFPDFTQGGTSSDDGSISIEIGRGVKKTNGAISRLGLSREFSSNAAMSQGDDSFNIPAPMIGDYEVMSTPPIRPQAASTKSGETARSSLRKDASIRRASNLQKETTEHSPPLAKITDYVSGGNRQGSAEHRRTLAEMHARVTDQDDGSRISEDRPPTVTLTARNTRFDNARNRQTTASDALPERFSSTKGLMHSLSQVNGGDRQHTRGQANATVTSINNGGTQQSFMLPDMPNLSELVSGVYQDGTPVFSRHGKTKASRFVSGSQQHRNQSNARPEYAAVSEIPVPADEQAIFLSLKLLQDRVAELETNRAEAEKTIQELQQKNWALEAEKTDRGRRERSDSALGMTDGGSDGADHGGRSQRKWTIEKSRFEATVRGLQDRAEAADRKASVAEITIKNITQDRDSAVSQLGVAYYTTEELKRENAALREENDDLKSQLSRLIANNDDRKHWPAEKGIELRKRRDPREEVAQNTTEMTADTFGSKRLDEQRQKSLYQHGDGKGRATAGGEEEELSVFSKTRSDVRARDQSSSVQASIFDHVQGNAQPQSNAKGRVGTSADLKAGQASALLRTKPAEQSRGQKRQSKQAIVEELSEDENTDNSAYEATTGRYGSIPVVQSNASHGFGDAAGVDDSAQDLTYLSFLDSEEVAKLRKTLEAERVARKQRRTTRNTTTKPDDDSVRATLVRENDPERGLSLPRKSSMKNVTGKLSNFDDGNKSHGENQLEEPTHTKTATLHHRWHSENSVLSRQGGPRGHDVEEMTSAFILPDITLCQPLKQAESAPELSTAAQQVLDGLAQHDGQNCTVCKRVIEHGVTHRHDELAKETIIVPKPVPVSERMPEAMPYEEEPTIRPSQPPGLALATVMKGLQDELAHLKMQLSQYQSLYHRHDPALSKRKRKSVYKKVESLLKAIDVKADQIYALYDVLEGQKVDGHEISEEEIEVTLQSIGIDVGGLGLRGGELSEKEAKAAGGHAWEVESTDGSEEELPWEGVESTVETSKSGRGAVGRCGSWTA